MAVAYRSRSSAYPTPLEGPLPPGFREPDNEQYVSRGTLLGERYRLIRLLGRGGMGVVYEAEDISARGQRVAIKLLSRERALALYQLKNEFRSLADVRHPSLVRLHQLTAEEGQWFLVMDLVPGVDFAKFVNPTGQRFEEMRLRLALSQLLAGVAALHAAGKVHRDLKPNNVLVTPEGHAVIIDFGLVQDELEAGSSLTDARAFVGTPAYAAPEQVRGESCGPAADMYAIGVMLYEALTGAFPFESEGMAVLLRKVERDPPPPSSVCSAVPADLNELAMRLLSRDASARPTAEGALSALGITPPEAGSMLGAPAMVGRERELALLESALELTRSGQAAVVDVHGSSGMGKSSLIKRFGELAQREHDALVLFGRCYAREQVPFKAFDALVDQLARHLTRYPESARSELLPAELPLLARVFPAFERFVEVDSQDRRFARVDPLQLRERTFRALKEVLTKIAALQPVIVCLDDLQWGDADSASLLREMLTPPSAPSVLFVCAYRGEERSTSPMLGRLELGGALPVRTVDCELRPLTEPALVELARSLVPEHAPAEHVEQIVRESRGNPFLVLELARLVRRGRPSALREMVEQRLGEVEPDARKLLEIVSLAGRPLPLSVALKSAESGVSAVLELVAAHLVRLRIVDDRERIEPYHDRVREAVVQRIENERADALLEGLARTHARAHPEDVDMLVELYQRAGAVDKAARYAVQAAELAERALAFDRAADLYAFALAHGAQADLRDLEVACATACASAGRVREAGERFERAARRAHDAQERRELLRKSMLYYLTGGDLEPGERILRVLCEDIGLPTSPRQTWLAVLVAWWLYFLYLSGRRLRTLEQPEPRAQDASDERADERLELAFAAARGIGHHSMVQGSSFVVRGLLETRAQRNPRHWPLALVWEAQLECIVDGVPKPECDAAVARALAQVEARGTVQEHALVLASVGILDTYVGRLQSAEQVFERAEAILRERGLPVISVCNFTRSGRLAVWHASGGFDRVLAHADRWLLEARSLGDPFGELIVQVMGSHRFLALDDVASARASLEALQGELGKRNQLAADPWWRGDVELYAGEPERALEICRAARALPMQLSVESTSVHRSWLAFTEARTALACLARSRLSQHRTLARKRLSRLRAQSYGPALAQAAQIEAALAFDAGRTDHARGLLEEAARMYEAAGFALYAAACWHRLGLIRADDEGRAMVASSLATCAARGVRDPERWLRTLASGFV